MDKISELLRIIEEKEEYCNFTGGVDVKRISQVEDILNVTLSESYK
ncbi:hypothetical protein [Clostridium sp. DJ247]|nr:hypothetical protein [Clostridium sp. DJ247]